MSWGFASKGPGSNLRPLFCRAHCGIRGESWLCQGLVSPDQAAGGRCAARRRRAACASSCRSLAPHARCEGLASLLAAPFGIASLECALGLYVKALVEPGALDWLGLIRLMTEKPAKIIGVDKGTLGVGKQADVTIIDPQAKYKIDVNKFHSKSRNCPYHGWGVTSKVEKTIVGGEIRFSAGD